MQYSLPTPAKEDGLMITLSEARATASIGQELAPSFQWDEKKDRKSPLKKSVSKRLAKIQGGLCFYCGRAPEASRGRFPTMDHFIPHSKGGSDSEHNLVFACQSCDSRKGDRLPTGEEIAKFEALKSHPAA